MSDQQQVTNTQAGSRRGRGCLLWLGRFALVIVALMLAGTVYELAAEAADLRAYPPPGKMVDVGGYRLHLNCTGSGSPTVVIDAGLGDWSLPWTSVQVDLAKTTHVCTYDRAGMGWSDAGPLPRDAEQFAKELHHLLELDHVPGPYVMVGHSMGGLTVLMFVHDYPDDVAGVVLIESMSPAQFKQPPDSAQPGSKSSNVPAVAFVARIGLVRLLAEPLGLEPDLAPEQKKAYTALSVAPRSVQAYVDESAGMPYSGLEAAAVKTFGDLPLIVLSRRPGASADDKTWQVNQTGLLALSSNSQQLFSAKNDHNIESSEPDAAVAAIIKMINQLRAAAGR